MTLLDQSVNYHSQLPVELLDPEKYILFFSVCPTEDHQPSGDHFRCLGSIEEYAPALPFVVRVRCLPAAKTKLTHVTPLLSIAHGPDVVLETIQSAYQDAHTLYF